MLIGSKSERMTKLGLNRLSTFGILAEFAQPEVVRLIDALAAAGLVESTDVDRFRPVVDISEAGLNYLKCKGNKDLQIVLPDDLLAKVRFGGMRRLTPRPAAKPTVAAEGDVEEGISTTEGGEAPSLDVSGDPLYLKLKVMRAQWAREANQSAYTIFPNRTLEALVRERPRSPHELAAIKGVGPVTRERYGSALLSAIAENPMTSPAAAPTEQRPGPKPDHPKPSPIPERPPVAGRVEPAPVDRVPSSSSGKAYVPTEEWTWRLLDRGFSLEEAAAIRGLELAAIVRHATLMARKGHPVPLERCIPPDTLGSWEGRRSRGELGAPSEVEDPTGLWALFLACRAARP